jgi:endoglycosylceramidase
LRLFDKLNLNVMRLGISWAAVQPQKGEHGFDLAYLDKTRRMVEKAAEAGIYVVIECHQDLFAEKFMGDGMPSWAITRDWNTLPFPMPIHGLSMAKYDSLAHVDSAPINMKYSDFWGFEYGADAVTRAFWGLYTNYDGVQTEFVRFWGKLAETFSGMSNLLGYGEYGGMTLDASDIA